jgi:hypothetical protein
MSRRDTKDGLFSIKKNSQWSASLLTAGLENQLLAISPAILVSTSTISTTTGPSFSGKVLEKLTEWAAVDKLTILNYVEREQ